ncbi:uncharacterized protein E0L32_003860 [Thyridium curvatum]|uniref:Symplekin/Pta1 N-terminal domain-containing protein n=1 Tax=Thyridium curvatum TaxID=1093900 RepID=A0A507BBF1_9PEZI|nr:uncharacterized protein E0L32_003860 [Thyridium curvatum]TPX16566.1 hypothetical protein E0L32_003860 [Thyridium curvatum]
MAAATATTTAPTDSSIAEQIRQLNDARKLVLGDVAYYPSIVQSILPIIGPSSHPELRRWGADFLAEAFATPALPSRDKETLSLVVLETLKGMVESASEDTINNSYDAPTWERMQAIKSRIFRIWEGSPPAVRICCIKFAQRVVLAQTHGAGSEQKRDGLEVSLAMVPPDHPVLDARQLEAEATGLLDRMLGILQDNSSDALLVDATINTLSVLIRTRPSTTNRILNAIFNFNPLKLANSPMTSKTRVLIKSMEKTTRMLLIHLIKRDPNHPLAPRIQQCIERLVRSKTEIFDDTSRKRALAETAAYGDAKRQKVEAEAPAQFQVPPLGPGEHSLAAIFTLTSNPALRAFNASLVPAELAAKVSVSTLAGTDPRLFDLAINGIRDRIKAMEANAAQPAALDPNTAPLGVEEDDDDDYEPDYYTAEDTEQILNKLDSAPDDLATKAETAALALGAFKLPPAPSLTPDIAAKVGQGTVSRVFGVMQTLEDPAGKRAKAGINRLAASTYDRDSWITVISRLATRPAAALGDGGDGPEEDDDDKSQVLKAQALSLGNAIRERLFNFILEDFRKRIELAVSWLSEEWYNDRVQQRYCSAAEEGGAQQKRQPVLHYDEWALRLMDGFLPYLHAQDKVLTRFLGELPELNRTILAKVRGLCRDPSLVQLALTSLVYLVMMRPPVREAALDTIQDIWLESEDARALAQKYLVKWRPEFVAANSGAAAGGGGAAAAAAAAPPKAVTAS